MQTEQLSCRLILKYSRHAKNSEHLLWSLSLLLYAAKRHNFIDTDMAVYLLATERSHIRSQWPRGLRRRLWPLTCWGCGFESHGGHGCLSVGSVVCCQAEVSATCWSLVLRSPAECVVSEGDREASIMRRPWSAGACCTVVKEKSSDLFYSKRQSSKATLFRNAEFQYVTALKFS